MKPKYVLLLWFLVVGGAVATVLYIKTPKPIVIVSRQVVKETVVVPQTQVVPVKEVLVVPQTVIAVQTVLVPQTVVVHEREVVTATPVPASAIIPITTPTAFKLPLVALCTGREKMAVSYEKEKARILGLLKSEESFNWKVLWMLMLVGGLGGIVLLISFNMIEGYASGCESYLAVLTAGLIVGALLGIWFGSTTHSGPWHTRYLVSEDDETKSDYVIDLQEFTATTLLPPDTSVVAVMHSDGDYLVEVRGGSGDVAASQTRLLQYKFGITPERLKLRFVDSMPSGESYLVTWSCFE